MENTQALQYGLDEPSCDGIEAISLFCPDCGSLYGYPDCSCGFMSVKHVEVTYLDRVTSPRSFKTIGLGDAIELIKGNTYQNQVCHLRSLSAAAYKAAKKLLPSFCFNGTFAGKVDNSGFVQSSGLFHFDIDGIASDDLADIKARLSSLSSVAFLFVSPSGNGLKGALRIDPEQVKNDADFKRVYARAEAFFNQMGIAIDKSCKDVRSGNSTSLPGAAIGC